MRAFTLVLFPLLAVTGTSRVQAEPVRVIVRLADQSVALAGAVSPDRVVATLQEHARSTQPAAVQAVEALGGRVEHRLWADNALIVSIEKDRVADLGRLPAVAEVFKDTLVPLPRFEARDVPAGDDEPVWSIAKIKAPEAWARYGVDGTGVVVGLIDTGIDPEHPDLEGKVLAFKDFVDESNRTPQDGQGHGTHVAGSIAGGSAEGRKIGVAPGARLVVARVFTARGATTAALLKAMEWIMDPDGNPATRDAPRVVSNSWGSNSRSDRSFWNVVQAWRAAGMFPSFAAGNAGPGARTVGIPGGYPHAFAVGATDSSDEIASFSSRGPVTWDGQERVKPEVSAPGHGVISARDGGGYRSLSGTSMACPHVSGLTALLVQANPAATVDELEAILEAGVVDLGPEGPDNDFGTGRVDAIMALGLARRSGITGTVKGSDGTPLAAAIKIDGDTEIVADAAGQFRASVPAGSHRLVFSHFGYRGASRAVTVPEGETVRVDVTLERAPSGTIRGRVLSSEGQEPRRATIQVAGTPLAPVATGADGRFQITLPHGSYTWVVSSRRHAVRRLTVAVDGDRTMDILLDPAKAFLLVDEALASNLASFYRQVLDALPGGADYDYHRVKDAGPIHGAELLSPYEVVIWYTGRNGAVLTAGERQALDGYLAGGGRLLLTGQGIGEAIGQTPFYRDRLHAKLVSSGMGTDRALTPLRDPLVNGVEPFMIQGGTGAGNQDAPDAIAPADDKAVALIKYYTLFLNRYAAIRAQSGTERVVYFGFGLEAVDDAGIRGELIRRSLAWLRPSTGERVERIGSLAGSERRDYLERLGGQLGLYDEGEPVPELRSLVDSVDPAVLPRAMRRRAQFPVGP